MKKKLFNHEGVKTMKMSKIKSGPMEKIRSFLNSSDAHFTRK